MFGPDVYVVIGCGSLRMTRAQDHEQEPGCQQSGSRKLDVVHKDLEVV